MSHMVVLVNEVADLGKRYGVYRDASSTGKSGCHKATPFLQCADLRMHSVSCLFPTGAARSGHVWWAKAGGPQFWFRE